MKKFLFYLSLCSLLVLCLLACKKDDDSTSAVNNPIDNSAPTSFVSVDVQNYKVEVEGSVPILKMNFNIKNNGEGICNSLVFDINTKTKGGTEKTYTISSDEMNLLSGQEIEIEREIGRGMLGSNSFYWSYRMSKGEIYIDGYIASDSIESVTVVSGSIIAS